MVLEYEDHVGVGTRQRKDVIVISCWLQYSLGPLAQTFRNVNR
jgi:hypothetical protein